MKFARALFPVSFLALFLVSCGDQLPLSEDKTSLQKYDYRDLDFVLYTSIKHWKKAAPPSTVYVSNFEEACHLISDKPVVLKAGTHFTHLSIFVDKYSPKNSPEHGLVIGLYNKDVTVHIVCPDLDDNISVGSLQSALGNKLVMIAHPLDSEDKKLRDRTDAARYFGLTAGVWALDNNEKVPVSWEDFRNDLALNDGKTFGNGISTEDFEMLPHPADLLWPDSHHLLLREKQIHCGKKGCTRIYVVTDGTVKVVRSRKQMDALDNGADPNP